MIPSKNVSAHTKQHDSYCTRNIFQLKLRDQNKTMALFQINRFFGDDEDKISEEQPSLILQKLKENARKKKKEKLSEVLKLEESKETVRDIKETVCSASKRKAICNTEIQDSQKKKKTDHIGVETELQIFIDEKEEQVHNLDSSVKKKSSKKDQKTIEKLAKTENEKHQKTVKRDKKLEKHLENNNIDSSTPDDTAADKKLPQVEHKNLKLIRDGPHTFGNFTVLGDYKAKPEVKATQVLPEWLSNPGIISNILTETSVDKLHILDPSLINKLQENNITHFFPVQTQILPLLLHQITDNNCYGKDGYQPPDICVSAPTGSGKTLAFALPIIQTLLNRVVCRVRALVVLPVRDLALQVFEVFQTYCKGSGLRVTLLAGHNSFTEEQKSLVVKRINGFCSLADIVVATPGRLVDHINKTTGLDLSQLRFLVIDEADRMMDDIKQDWLSHVEKSVLRIHGDSPWNKINRYPARPLTVSNCTKIKIAFQKLLFSATLSQDPEKLQELNLFQPQLYTTLVKSNNRTQNSDANIDEDKESEDNKGEFVGKYATPTSLKERHIECKASLKPLSVLHCIHNLKYRQILCFTNSVESTHRLFLLIKLCGGINVREFSSALSGTARQKILHGFSTGKIDMIICSDAMARGMDIENVQYVILYGRPMHIQTYIHRVGRTARAGKSGTAITILEPREVCSYKAMLREAGKQKFKKIKIKPSNLFSLNPMYYGALEKLPIVIKAEKNRKKESH